MILFNDQAVNRAARILSKSIKENFDLELKHTKALDIIARMQGFPNHMAANSLLDSVKRNAEFGVKTWRDLWQLIATMDENELDAPVVISEGCDENGNAQFHTGSHLLKAKSKRIEAAVHTCPGEGKSHVLIFEANALETQVDKSANWPEPLPSDIPRDLLFVTAKALAIAVERFANQAELNEIMSYDQARCEYINNPLEWEGKLLTGDYVIVLKDEFGGYYNTLFGWTSDRSTASGWETEQEAMYFLTQSLLDYQQSVEAKKDLFKVIKAEGFANQHPRFDD